MVMGGDSCSKGHEFESGHRILDGHLFTFICCLFEKTKINEKEAGVGHLFLKKDLGGGVKATNRQITKLLSDYVRTDLR